MYKRKNVEHYLKLCNYLNERSPRIQSSAHVIFKKSYNIISYYDYELPSPELMFFEDPWQILELQYLKKQLNYVKSKLNNYNFAKWHKHTSERNKARNIEKCIRTRIDPEFVTQAWCKFHEIISKYPLVPKKNIYANDNLFVSLHLCEAPGAFITCLNHWLKTHDPTIRWNWSATTYNPYYEGNSNKKMISDDRFIMHTLENWIFGKDNTGNLMTLENLDYLIERLKTKGKVHLITADGSVNCFKDPGEQERIVSNLLFCEVVAAMHILETGGNFLLKIFTIFEHQTVCLLYLLTCAFNKIHFYKPVTSKEGNSEVYVICLDFKGPKFISSYLPVLRKEYELNSDKAMFTRDSIPESFLLQLKNCAEFFTDHQRNAIENNIHTWICNGPLEQKEIKLIAGLVADKFMMDFPLIKLHMDLQIVGNLKLKSTRVKHWIFENPVDSFNKIQKKQVLKPVQQLLLYLDQLNSLEIKSKTYTFKCSNLTIDIDTFINTGRPYQRIHSSRFCSIQISEIYDLFFKIVDTEKNMKFLLPTDENVAKYELKMQEVWNESYKILHFKYTDVHKNEETLLHIKDVLCNLEMENNLVLNGFLLLTQFNVGLIYLLTYTFDSVEININEEIGCSIIFKCFKRKDRILELIEDICRVAKSALTDNVTICSLISVKELYGSELYPIVVEVNNWIAKYFVNYTDSLYKECQQIQ